MDPAEAAVGQDHHLVPFAQVRAVSNIVERRNRGAWRLAEAIDSLAEAARRILAET